MKTITFDLETTKHSSNSFSADPHDPANWVVSVGLLADNGNGKTSYKEYYLDNSEQLSEISGELLSYFKWADVIVAHNANFDVSYLWHRLPAEFRDDILPSKELWCTMAGAWWISGQQKGFMKLDEVATLPGVGGTIKEGPVPEMLKDPDCMTEEIDRDLLMEYMEDDVTNCHKAHKAQVGWAAKRNMLTFVQMRCTSILATVEMECQGMKFDVVGANEAREVEAAKVKRLELAVKKEMAQYFHPWFWEQINPGSDDQVSACLFGGDYSGFVYAPQGGFKSAKVYPKSKDKRKRSRKMLTQRLEKISKKKLTMHTDGAGLPPTEETKKEGVYSCSQGNLKGLKGNSLIDLLFQWRAGSKNLGTYFDGFISKCDDTGFIHGRFNHTIAVTGRLTSSAPNLQNISNKGDNDDHSRI